jgi:SAM-dependent methyltransferase
MNFPDTPLANEFSFATKHSPVAPLVADQELFPLNLVLCDACGHLQVTEIVDPDRLFKNYVYVTGTSPLTVAHFEGYVRAVMDRFPTKTPPFVVEVGSNDGTMLRAFKKLGASVLGIDPATEIARKASDEGLPTINGFFGTSLADNILSNHGQADIVVANNVFAHAEDLVDIASGARMLIGDSGVFVFEVAYLLDMVEHNLFDTVYHEHYSYHAVNPIARSFERLGLHVFNVERTPAQLGRGSIRLYASSASAKRDSKGAVISAIRAEQNAQLHNPATYHDWRKRITATGQAFKAKLEEIRASGANIVGFGAPAKATTLMYTFGLTREHCSFIVDDSPWKQGLLTPGLHIPVFPPSALERFKPDVCVIYAWNFADSILERFKGSGIKFIVPLPEYKEVIP